MVKLAEYLPNYYDDVVETDALMAAEQKLFDDKARTTERLLMNQFVMEADTTGLALFESELKIKPPLGESIELRRQNILLRILPPSPLTLGYLRSVIQVLQIPVTIKVDSAKSLLQTYSDENVITAEQIERLKYMLNVYVPANLAGQVSTQNHVSTTERVGWKQAVQVMVATAVGAEPVDFVLLVNEMVNHGESKHIMINMAVGAATVILKEVS